MSNKNDFVIKDGTLTKYKGSGGDVIIPEGVTTIGDRAFRKCRELTSIIIPEGVTNIGEWAFYNCRGLTSVTIPGSVISIGSKAFEDCKGLNSVCISDLDGWFKINFYSCFANPLYYADNLFINNQLVTDLVIPDTVTNIGDYSFYGYRGLESVTIPESVTRIGSYAFSGCSGLKSVTIPESVISVGSEAFRGCNGLTSVTIPNSVTRIGDCAFENCSGLTSVSVASGNPEYDSRNNCNAIIKTSKNVLIFGCQSTVIPDSVTTIGDSAFSGCSGLTTVTIPKGVKEIGDMAFEDCSGLKSINIPESVTSIGYRAFSHCSRLTSLTIPESVTSIGEWAFSGCSVLTSVTIPESVTSIGHNAFAGSSGLTSVTIPKGVKCIGEYAFAWCNGLTSVTIPESVTSIGDGAFEDCSGLTSVTIPKGVTSIGYRAFYGCENLCRVIVLGKSELGENSFKDTSSLLTVELPITKIKPIPLKRCAVRGWLLREPDDPIADKTVIKSIRNYWNRSFDVFIDDIQNDNRLLPALIENEMLSIDQTDRLITLFEGNAEATAALLTYKRSRFSSDDLEKHEEKKIEKAFRGPTVTELKKIWTIKDQDDGTLELVTYKGTDTEIIVPEKIGKKTVTTISKECFGIAEGYGDNNRPVPNNDVREKITSVTIPDSVTSIGYSAFYGCKGLTSVTIPEGVTSIGNSAFRGCKGLADENGFVIINGVLYDYYGFGEDVIIPEGVTSIGNKAFEDCTGLTSVTIPEGVTSIGNYAFYKCSGLTSVTIPGSLTSIGDSAFYKCDNLTIHAPAVSYAEQYAKENNLPFVAE